MKTLELNEIKECECALHLSGLFMIVGEGSISHPQVSLRSESMENDVGFTAKAKELALVCPRG